MVHGQQSELLTYLCPGTGRGRETLAGSDEDSSARVAARPALAQCRALSVDWAGTGSPHRLYLTVQVSPGPQQGEGLSWAGCALVSELQAWSPQKTSGESGELPSSLQPTQPPTQPCVDALVCFLSYLRGGHMGGDRCSHTLAEVLK